MDISDIISINAHSSIRIALDKVLYFDPFHMNDAPHDADVIFITHDHYDHFSPEDILKIVRPETMFVLPESMKETASAAGIPDDSMLTVRPGKSYELDGLKFDAVPAYNLRKHYHPKENAWVGYVVTVGEKRVYVCGDTDAVPENMKIRCDIMIVPAGGTYTTDAAEAAAFVNAVKPACAIPSHYGDIVGTPFDGMDFSRRVKAPVQTRLLIHS